MKTVAIIPARYASTRFPAKALAILGGKPMIERVYQRVEQSKLFDEVIVATDHEEIMKAVKAFGGKVMMTSEGHQSGSDRIAEVAGKLKDVDLVFNIQGDEPLIDAEALRQLLDLFYDPFVDMASLMTPVTDREMLGNSNIVKVVTDVHGDALYFSRSCIPYDRDGDACNAYYRHIGVYAYRIDVLQEFVALEQGKLEQIEKLEQLRALENGIPIRMLITDYQGIGIDTPEDLARVEKEFFPS